MDRLDPVEDLSALHLAVQENGAAGHPAMVAFLLANGAAVDVVGRYGPGAQRRSPVLTPGATPPVLRCHSAA